MTTDDQHPDLSPATTLALALCEGLKDRKIFADAWSALSVDEQKAFALWITNLQEAPPYWVIEAFVIEDLNMLELGRLGQRVLRTPEEHARALEHPLWAHTAAAVKSPRFDALVKKEGIDKAHHAWRDKMNSDATRDITAGRGMRGGPSEKNDPPRQRELLLTCGPVIDALALPCVPDPAIAGTPHFRDTVFQAVMTVAEYPALLANKRLQRVLPGAVQKNIHKSSTSLCAPHER